MSLKIGDTAPDFTLFDSEKNAVSLSDFKGGKLLILFFPLAFTGVCTQELCSTRDGLDAYGSLGTKVVAISVDSFAALAEFKKQNNLNFPLLSDFNRTVSKDYGASYDEFILGMQGVSKRSAFVVDEAGKIIYAEVLEKATDLPNFEAIKTVLS